MDQKKLVGTLALALIALLMVVLFVLPYAAVSTLTPDTAEHSVSVSAEEALPEGAWDAAGQIAAMLKSCFE